MDYPLTPDGRYMVVRGRLWRTSNPHLDPGERDKLIKDLMNARREVKAALSAGDSDALASARSAVNVAKIALGERGPVWWDDGASDLNRHLVKNTPYRAWYDQLAGPQGSVRRVV